MMPAQQDDYRSQAVLSGFRRQAWRAWAVGVAIVFIWNAAILLAPLLKAGGLEGASSPIYHFFGFVCHQIPQRSFHIDNEPFAVCSRCFGVYFGLLSGFVIYPIWRRLDDIEPLPRFWLFLSLIPITIDWSLTIFGIWENTQLSRVITGLILGFVCAVYIVPAIVEITRNLAGRR